MPGSAQSTEGRLTVRSRRSQVAQGCHRTVSIAYTLNMLQILKSIKNVIKPPRAVKDKNARPLKKKHHKQLGFPLAKTAQRLCVSILPTEHAAELVMAQVAPELSTKFLGE